MKNIPASLSSLFYISCLFIFSSLITLGFSQDSDNQNNVISLASIQGYNLTTENDQFFSDICQPFTSESNKDVSLYYRRKYYYYPSYQHKIISTKKEILYHFNEPYRNKVSECFKDFFTTENIFKNSFFYILFIIFFIQSFFLIWMLIGKYKDVSKNTPKEKMRKQNLNFLDSNIDDRSGANINSNNSNTIDNLKTVNENKKYSELVETYESSPKEKNKKLNKENTGFNNRKNILVEEEINDNFQNNNNDNDGKSDQIDNFTFHYKKESNSNSDKNLINENSKEKEQLQENKEDIHDEKGNDELNITGCFEEGLADNNNNNIRSLNNNNNNIENNEKIERPEKSKDNYTFGGKFGFALDLKAVNRGENLEEDEEEEQKEKKTGKNNEKIETSNESQSQIMKKIEENEKEDEKIEGEKPSIQNNQISISTQKRSKLLYTKEEYFYFGYALAILEDKRSIIEIYKNILEHCQIIFIFFSPMLIFEDFKQIIIYYLMKIQLYIFFHILFFKNSLIDKIYDDKSVVADILIDSFIINWIVILCSELFYSLNNCKKMLIKQRYKIENLRVSDEKKNTKIKTFFDKIIFDILYEKIIFLSIVSIVLFGFTFKYGFCFFFVYKNSKLFLFYKVLLSVILAQTAPFIFAWIPAWLRNYSIQKRNYCLYKITKLIEGLFIP